MLLKIYYVMLVIQSKKTEYNTKTEETESKITTDNDKYVTFQEFYKLTSEFHCKISISKFSKQN